MSGVLEHSFARLIVDLCVVGAVLGSLIFGMVRQGIVFARVDADWFQVVLGVMLLIAVLVNRFVRDRALRA